MTARFFVTCPKHPTVCPCPDDAAYRVESAAAALALHAAQFPEASGKRAYVAITCELSGCLRTIAFAADSITQGRVMASSHNYGWYQTRRSSGRLADGCQFHLGKCCIHHVGGRFDHHTVDRNAVLPGMAVAAAFQPSLFEGMA